MTVDHDLVRVARAVAATAAHRSRVEMRPLTTLAELVTCEELFVSIWGGDHPPMAANLLRALSSAGSYVVGAFGGDGPTQGLMLAACVGFWGPPDAPSLHSHIAGVAPNARGRDLGYALKLHQRADALAHDVSAITWTYDPLIARNAHFNIRKLGGRPASYAVNYYGAMPDAINAGDETDRMVLRWELGSAATRAACDGEVDQRLVHEPFTPMLEIGPAGEPVTIETDTARVAVGVPPDAEGLRAVDPALARAWRMAVRETLGGLMRRGGRVVDFDRTGIGYLVERGPS